MVNPERGIRLRSSARTSVGQIRENNEDNIRLWTRDEFVLAVVADGMGGAAAGEEASRIAVETIQLALGRDDVENLEESSITERLRDTIQDANRSIMEKAATAPEMRGMGTTVTLAFVRGTYATVAHVGDSRAYLVDGESETISQITSDHSFVEALLSAGHITEEQAAEHPMRNVLYRALGQAEEIDVDMYYKRLHVGDRLVLCSDGLTRHVKPDEIAELTLANSNPDVASQKLIDLANARGGEDNVSVIVIAVERSEPNSPPEREAVMLDTAADDDETLVLKDRPTVRAAPPQKQSSPRAEQKNLPAMDIFSEETAKLDAERLKDDLDVTPVDDEAPEPIVSDITIDRAISLRPDAEGRQAPPATEGLSEGRDTLVPEQ
jgi:serine/threonine protein phosphatase PrpC